MSIKLELPLRVSTSQRGKDFILNLNTFRNAHFQVISKAKKMYKALVYDQLNDAQAYNQQFHQVSLSYTYYHPNRRRVDLMNPVTVIDKFTLDALVSYGLIEDDNSKFVSDIQIHWGGVDKDNPRCELVITEVK